MKLQEKYEYREILDFREYLYVGNNGVSKFKMVDLFFAINQDESRLRSCNNKGYVAALLYLYTQELPNSNRLDIIEFKNPELESLERSLMLELINISFSGLIEDFQKGKLSTQIDTIDKLLNLEDLVATNHEAQKNVNDDLLRPKKVVNIGLVVKKIRSFINNLILSEKPHTPKNLVQNISINNIHLIRDREIYDQILDIETNKVNSLILIRSCKILIESGIIAPNKKGDLKFTIAEINGQNSIVIPVRAWGDSIVPFYFDGSFERWQSLHQDDVYEREIEEVLTNNFNISRNGGDYSNLELGDRDALKYIGGKYDNSWFQSSK